jgi:5-(carboxyamino)imidazole ribonucleotide mutase
MKKVAIIMGSDSDLPTMRKAFQTLRSLSVPFEAHIFSAHRTPDEAAAFALNAREAGFGAIIAAAGKAAHLAGALAARTTLPVIGVPISSSDLDGLDALLSTVQMPTGIPVATVAIGGAANAALLAAQILSVNDADIAARLDSNRREMQKIALEKDAALQREAGAGCGSALLGDDGGGVSVQS